MEIEFKEHPNNLKISARDQIDYLETFLPELKNVLKSSGNYIKSNDERIYQNIVHQIQVFERILRIRKDFPNIRINQ